MFSPDNMSEEVNHFFCYRLEREREKENRNEKDRRDTRVGWLQEC